MLDSNNTDRPARRTALIAQELSQYNVDIVALSETRLPDESSLTEDQSGYTFYWKGYRSQEARIRGIGFAIKNSLVPVIESAPTGISARRMRLRVLLTHGRRATLFSCYGLTLSIPEDDKDAFYEQRMQNCSEFRRRTS